MQQFMFKTSFPIQFMKYGTNRRDSGPAMILRRLRRFALKALVVTAMIKGLVNPAYAQSGQWQLVVLSATSAGWVETRGTATISEDFSQIYVKDKAGISREVYRGVLKDRQWSGTRSVINTEMLGQPFNGEYASRTIDRYRVETLILTSSTASANFIRTQPVQ